MVNRLKNDALAYAVIEPYLFLQKEFLTRKFAGYLKPQNPDDVTPNILSEDKCCLFITPTFKAFYYCAQ